MRILCSLSSWSRMNHNLKNKPYSKTFNRIKTWLFSSNLRWSSAIAAALTSALSSSYFESFTNFKVSFKIYLNLNPYPKCFDEPELSTRDFGLLVASARLFCSVNSACFLSSSRTRFSSSILAFSSASRRFRALSLSSSAFLASSAAISRSLNSSTLFCSFAFSSASSLSFEFFLSSFRSSSFFRSFPIGQFF